MTEFTYGSTPKQALNPKRNSAIMSTVKQNKGDIQMSKGKFFIFIGCILLLVALIFGGLDIYYAKTYDKTEAEISIVTYTRKGKTGKRAHVSYEYDGELYEDIALSSYNGFTMKDGKKITVYINPDKPEWPKTTDLTMIVVLIIFGGLCIAGGLKSDQND